MSNSSKDVHTDDLSRFQLLQRAFEKAVATFLENGCSYSQFSECFEPMSSVYPEDFELLHKQLQQLLDIRLKQEFQLLVEEKDIATKLQVCDQLFQQYHVDRNGNIRIPFHKQNPSDWMKTVTCQQKQKLKDKLCEQRNQLGKTVKELERQVLETRQQVDKCKADIQHLVDTSAEAVQVANQNLPLPN